MRTLRVYPPSQIIFLCGGQTRSPNAPPRAESLRDAFQRIRHGTALQKYRVRLAEEVIPFYPTANYRDLLSFESDIAQICELILLFSESIGSLCELGAFAMEPDIARKMLTVVERRHYEDRSFVRLGPIQLQINQYGQAAVHVLDSAMLGIAPPLSIADINLSRFEATIADAIRTRLAGPAGAMPGPAEHTRFNPGRNGHIVKLIVGIVQHYGAATIEEIDLILTFLGLTVPKMALENFLLCAKFVEWIVEDPIGGRVLYSAKPGNRAIGYDLKPGFNPSKKDRWLVDVRDYWEKHDSERFYYLKRALA